jgi:hypothetical protein
VYNKYGGNNLAVCDFDNILIVDLRPLTSPEYPGKLPRASFHYLGMKENPKNWRNYQRVLLGFLERGYQWIEPDPPKPRGVLRL